MRDAFDRDALAHARHLAGAEEPVDIVLTCDGPDGWRAAAPGVGSGYSSSPWRALAEAIWIWDIAGRPSAARLCYGFAGGPESR